MITFTKYTMDEIYKWTDSNFHNISRAYTCKMMGEIGLAEMYMSIAKSHEEFVSFTEELIQERNDLDKVMIKAGQSKVSNWNKVSAICFYGVI